MTKGETIPDQEIKDQDGPRDTVEGIFYDLVDVRYPDLNRKSRQEAVARMTSMVLELAAQYHTEEPKEQ